jgi:hypothetical protein
VEGGAGAGGRQGDVFEKFRSLSNARRIIKAQQQPRASIAHHVDSKIELGLGRIARVIAFEIHDE